MRATPDGYTLLLAVPPSAINATPYEWLNYTFRCRSSRDQHRIERFDSHPVAHLRGHVGELVAIGAYVRHLVSHDE